jgi:hypothetical protein
VYREYGVIFSRLCEGCVVVRNNNCCTTNTPSDRGRPDLLRWEQKAERPRVA